MPKCDFNKVAPTLLNHTSAWVFSCNRPIGTGEEGALEGGGCSSPRFCRKLTFYQFSIIMKRKKEPKNIQ